jgi:hypothetical protein
VLIIWEFCPDSEEKTSRLNIDVCHAEGKERW